MQLEMIEQLSDVNDITIAYVNGLLRENHHLKSHVASLAMRPEKQAAQPVEVKDQPAEAKIKEFVAGEPLVSAIQMAAVRAKNTELEEENRKLRDEMGTYKTIITNYRPTERQHQIEIERLKSRIAALMFAQGI